MMEGFDLFTRCTQFLNFDRCQVSVHRLLFITDIRKRSAFSKRGCANANIRIWMGFDLVCFVKAGVFAIYMIWFELNLECCNWVGR